MPFSKEEFRSVITNCNNSSIPGLDKLSWSHFKTVLKYDDYLTNIINIANTCINLDYWPTYFKRSTIVVIPKFNKQLYNSPKSFRPIVLLNTLGKLIEKFIGKRLQFQVISNDFIHLSQLSSLKFKSTIDVDIALIHIIHLGWVKNILTNTLAFNIAQFFPSLNHHLLTRILKKVELDNCIVNFFANYLVGRKTNYFWNNFTFPIFDANIEVGQGSALFPILSLSFSLYFRKLSKKSQYSCVYYFFCG